MAKASYEILGVDPRASEKEIKRAYFKLIREHSPEKDPEGFKEIRAAYENMLTPSAEEQVAPFTLKDEEAIKAKENIEAMLKRKAWKQAIKICQAAVVIWPDSSYFKYLLVKSYRGNKNTGKAVTLSEELCRQEPLNKYYWREYAMSCYARGFFNKAREGFYQAYEMGIRDIEFLIARVDNSGDNWYAAHFRRDDYYEIIDMHGEDPNHYNDIVMLFERLVSCYTGFGFFGFMFSTVNTLGPDLKRAADYLIDHYDDLREDGMNLYLLISQVAEEKPSLIDDSLMAKLDQLIQLYGNDGNTPYIKDFVTYLERKKIEQDPRVHTYIEGYIYRRKNDDDPLLQEYIDLDRSLLILKARDKILPSLRHVRETYPRIWKENQAFFRKVMDPNKAKILLDEYRRRFRFLSIDFEGGIFYKQFPEEARLRLQNIGYNRSKFSKPLVGRNDPCPCGSGKKFKKCCMGKGLYD